MMSWLAHAEASISCNVFCNLLLQKTFGWHLRGPLLSAFIKNDVQYPLKTTSI